MSMLDFLGKARYGGYPLTVSATDKTLLGYVHTSRLRAYIERMMDEAPLTVTEETSCVFGKYLGAVPPGALDLSKEVDEGVLRVHPNTPAAQIHSYFRYL